MKIYIHIYHQNSILYIQTHIINYTLPDDPEVYVHRSGRTGRAGNKGLSIALVTKKEQQRLKEIEKLFKISFIRNEIPTEVEIFKSQIDSFTDTIVITSIPSEKDKYIFNVINGKYIISICPSYFCLHWDSCRIV